MRRRSILAGAVVVCLLCGLGLQAQQSDSSASDNANLLASSQPAAGAVPRLIKFAGVVKDLTGKVPTGVVGLTFSLYELPEGGNPLWVETQNLTLDSLGHYTVLLGANSPEGLPLDLFTSSKALWLGVQAQLPGEAEQARVLLVAVPYALKSSDADTLGGLPASAYMLAANANTVVSVPLPPPIRPPGAPPRGPITGAGTPNFAAMFTGPYTIGDSVIYNSTGGFVGIGTPAPAATLEVNGTTKFDGAVTFAAGQAFPGAGTVTKVGSGSGLTGGPITTTGTLSIDTTVVPELAISNNFTASQFVYGYLDAYGVGNGTALYGFNTSTDSTDPTLYLENDDSTSAGDLVFEAVGPSFGGLCTIDVSGNLFCTGTLQPSIRKANNSSVGLYTMQSSENWIEDFGSGALSNGVAVVQVSPDLAGAVSADASYHVFLTPHGDCEGLYVTNRTATSFEVHELKSGRSNVEFDYRIVAHRKGFETVRLPDVTAKLQRKVPRPKVSGRSVGPK